jgi:hypothetical protein
VASKIGKSFQTKFKKLAKSTLEKQHFPEYSQLCCQRSDKIWWEITKSSKGT